MLPKKRGFTPPATLKRFGYRNVVIWNGTLSGLSLFACAFFTQSTPVALILFVLLISGFVQSLQFSSLNSLPYADVSPQQMSSATSLSQLTQQVGRGTGVAMAAALLHLVLGWRGEAQLSTFEFMVAFIASGIVSLASILFFVRLPLNSGWELSGHKRNQTISPKTPI